MYKTRSASGGSMGSLRRDYVARIPIDLNCSPLSSKASHAASSSSSAASFASHHRRGGTARLLIGGGGPNVVQNGGGVSLVRCRVDSDNSPTVIGFSDDDYDDYDDDAYHVTQQRPQKPQETMTSSSGAGDVSVRSWSTSSEGRETGSILKKPEHGGGGGGSQTLSDRSSSGGGKQRTPQGRRRVRFTNNVSLYRFDSDGVDSAYSSSECERLYAPIGTVVAAAAAARRPGTPNSSRHPSSTPVNSSSSSSSSSTLSPTNRAYSAGDDFPVYENAPRSVVVSRRIQDDSKAFTLSPPPPPPPSLHPPGIIRQEVRAAQVLHGTPNGSLYLRNSHEKTKTVLPSAHWLSRTPPPPTASSSQQKQQQGPVIVGGSSGALRATSYTVISDTLTQERKLIVAAKLADSFHPNDITIKANKNGNKIRIVSIKSPSLHPLQGQGPSRHQTLNEQILLPVQVDPWRLTARLDQNGSLHIEAPCAD